MPTVKYLDRDGATQPPATFDLGHAVAGRPQTPRKFAIENVDLRILGASPFNGSELRRLVLAAGLADGTEQFRIALDTATLSCPYGPVTATLGAAADGGVWAGTGNQFYRVTAYNAVGETIGSVECVVLVDDVTKRVTIAWAEIAGADGYRVWRSTVSGVYGPDALVADVVGGAVTTYIDDGTAAGAGTIPTVNTTGGWALDAVLGVTADGGVWSGTGARFWRVVAVDAEGVVIAATLEATVTVDDITKRVTLDWDAVAAAAGYLVYRSEASEVYAAALRATLGAVTTYIDDGTAAGAGDFTGGPSYGIPPALGLGPLNVGQVPRGKQVFFWIDRDIPAPTPTSDLVTAVQFVEL
jgi:hypothetical protein